MARLFTSSAHGILAERFESEHVKAALGWHAINASVAGPSTPGTAFVLLHDHASEETDSGVRQWGFVRGGVGVLTSIMADVAREAGAEIRCSSNVSGIVTLGGDCVGCGWRAGAVRGSGAVERGPEAHVPDAVRPGGSAGGLRAADRGLPVNGHQHQDQPGVERLALCGRASDGRGAAVSPGDHGGKPPFTAEMDLRQAQAQYGLAARDSHVEIVFPTGHDSSLAPDGKHIATIDVNSQPFHLREESGDEIKETRADEGSRSWRRTSPV